MARAKRRSKAGWRHSPGDILFEVDGVTEAIARESMRLAATKLRSKLNLFRGTAQ